MKRDYLPIETLSAWTRLNGIAVEGVAFRKLRADDGTDKGSAIVATGSQNGGGNGERPESEESGVVAPGVTVLLRVPSDLVLSLGFVEDYAKSDRQLREVLEAVGGVGRTARGAILIFLLVQLTHSSPDYAHERHAIGLSSPWTEYVKYMPAFVLLPTFYTDEEQELLRGTSLRLAVHAKIASLEKEFEHLRRSTEGHAWCEKYWWSEDTGKLTFDDWKHVDALYRSRMVDLPRHGHAMVPCIDMANHAAEGTVKALYNEDEDGNAVLQMRDGKSLREGEEVTISYGDDKPASEMIFSYGFLDGEKATANQIFLDLDIPDDDPLKIAKKAFCKDAPGVKLSSTAIDSETGATTSWDSPIIWWACVNEEDGLDFNVLQTTDGGRELRATWKGDDVKDPGCLRELLAADPQWDIYQLRAVVLILERLETQFFVLRQTDPMVLEIHENEDMRAIFRTEVFDTVLKLRDLESSLLEKGIEDLVRERENLMASPAVSRYLTQQSGDVEEEDDFS
ncbi:SET domain-containing protein [Aspergillus heteromorphus CBS 117.55]|uniref:SET domain-containing protein n=1 Tax=Aspergillus heteromorphus CBS 117.55 TaxID=1448321 RepID=A0A317VVA5_9EURO|nr:SET domain-containing protein [Aspergillus heteromorphus CBS 117.55]PWY77539.1 SET domain-containing protein [Aspergillus heteromorphus CBS 117.55]